MIMKLAFKVGLLSNFRDRLHYYTIFYYIYKAFKASIVAALSI